MSKIKELYMEYQEQLSGSNSEHLDDEYHFQKWLESLPQVSADTHITQSIFPNDLFYDDEYYKSTYHPTKEEEDEAFKLFNKE